MNEAFSNAYSTATEFADSIPKVMENYSAAERKILNGGGELPLALTRKVVGDILVLAEWKLNHIKAGQLPNDVTRLLDAFAFREALCAYIWLLTTLKGTPPTNPRKITNSIFDMSFVAFATYFDGLLSKDRMATEIYEIAMNWLRSLRASRSAA